MDQETKKYLDRINSKINMLIESQKKETWVSVSWITGLTGWDECRLRKAREQGIIKHRKSNGKHQYLLESLPQQFLIKQTA